MLEQAIAVYCVCDEVLKTLNLIDDVQCKMSSAEVMTFAILSASIFNTDYFKTRLICKALNFFPKILSHSQLVRRIHKIPDYVWMLVFQALQLTRNKSNQYFIVDSFPVKAYENHKSFRARIFSEKKFHGYSASRKQYFFGIKVHMVIDSDGIPIEFSFTPGGKSDIKSLQEFTLELPEGTFILGDSAYTSYQFEDDLKYFEDISLLTRRAYNLKRQNTACENYILSSKRGYIETVFSCITRKMPRYIRARTEKGFCIKVVLCILSYMVGLFYPLR